jgi:DNA-binding transcriptional ArsR family regulator
MQRRAWSGAAVVALALWAAAMPALALGADDLVSADLQDARASLDVDGLSLPRTLDAPNPVTLAMDGADLAAFGLAGYDDGGFWAGAAQTQAPVAWFPGALDERHVHGGYFLAFTQPSDAIAAQALGAYDDAASGPVALPQPDTGRVKSMPNLVADLDLPELRLDARLESAVQDAQAAAAPLAYAGVAGAQDAEASVADVGAGMPAWFPARDALVDAPDAALALHGGPDSVGPLGIQFPDWGFPALPDGALWATAAAASALFAAGALYHLVNRENIFENDMRTRIYELIARQPGVTIGEVARQVGLSHPTVRYHINMLQKNELIVFLDQGNKLMLFRNRHEFGEREREIVALIRSVEAMRVYDCIAASPWILRKELAEQLGISRTSVNWHLRSLMKCGLVGETREQGKGFLFASREGKDVLQSVAARSGQSYAPPPPLALEPPPALTA